VYLYLVSLISLIAHNVVDFLFVDDFAAGYASTNMNIIERKLQQTINKLDKKAVLSQGNRAMPQVFFSVEVRQQHSLQV